MNIGFIGLWFPILWALISPIKPQGQTFKLLCSDAQCKTAIGSGRLVKNINNFVSGTSLEILGKSSDLRTSQFKVRIGQNELFVDASLVDEILVLYDTPSLVQIDHPLKLDLGDWPLPGSQDQTTNTKDSDPTIPPSKHQSVPPDTKPLDPTPSGGGAQHPDSRSRHGSQSQIEPPKETDHPHLSTKAPDSNVHVDRSDTANQVAADEPETEQKGNGEQVENLEPDIAAHNKESQIQSQAASTTLIDESQHPAVASDQGHDLKTATESQLPNQSEKLPVSEKLPHTLTPSAPDKIGTEPKILEQNQKTEIPSKSNSQTSGFHADPATVDTTTPIPPPTTDNKLSHDKVSTEIHQSTIKPPVTGSSAASSASPKSSDFPESKVPKQTVMDQEQKSKFTPTAPSSAMPDLGEQPDLTKTHRPTDQPSSEPDLHQSHQVVKPPKSETTPPITKPSTSSNADSPSDDSPKPGVSHQTKTESTMRPDHPDMDKTVESGISQTVPTSQVQEPSTYSDSNQPKPVDGHPTMEDTKQTTKQQPNRQEVQGIRDSIQAPELAEHSRGTAQSEPTSEPEPPIQTHPTVSHSNEQPRAPIAPSNLGAPKVVESDGSNTAQSPSQTDDTVAKSSSADDAVRLQTRKDTTNDRGPTSDSPSHVRASVQSESFHKPSPSSRTVPSEQHHHHHQDPASIDTTSTSVPDTERGHLPDAGPPLLDIPKTDSSVPQQQQQQQQEHEESNKSSHDSTLPTHHHHSHPHDPVQLESPDSSVHCPVSYGSSHLPVHLGLMQCLTVAAQFDKDNTKSPVKSPLSRLVIYVIRYFETVANRLLDLFPQSWIEAMDHVLVDLVAIPLTFLLAWAIFVLHAILVYNLAKLAHKLWLKFGWHQSEPDPRLALIEAHELIEQLTNQLNDQQESNHQLSEWSVQLNQDLAKLRQEQDLKNAEISQSLGQTTQLYKQSQSELVQLRKSHAELEKQLHLSGSEKDKMCDQLKSQLKQLESELEQTNLDWQQKLRSTESKHEQTIKDLESEQEQLYNQANNYYNRMKSMQTEVEKIMDSRKQVEHKLEQSQTELQSLLMTFNTLKSFELALDQGKLKSKSGRRMRDSADSSSFTMIGVKRTHTDEDDDVEEEEEGEVDQGTGENGDHADGEHTTSGDQIEKPTGQGEESGEIEDDSGSDPDLAKIKENLSLFLDVGRLQAQLNLKDEQIRDQERKLQYEQDLRSSLEAQFELAEKENLELRGLKTSLEQEKLAIETKLDVLTNYFKERELELQRDLGKQVVVGSESSEALSNMLKRNQELEGEIKVLRDQLSSTRKLMSEMERTNHRKISELDKRSHENWLAARSADHRVKELQEETVGLRVKLAECQRNLLPPALRSLPANMPGTSMSPVQTSVAFSRPNLPAVISPNPKFDNKHSLSRQSLNSLSSQRSGLPDIPFLPPPLPPPGMIPPPPPPPGAMPLPPNAFGSGRMPFPRAGFPPPPPPPPPGLMMPGAHYSNPSSVTGSSR